MTERTRQANSWNPFDMEIWSILERETRKKPEKMDMELIRDGLDFLYPFNPEEDRQRAHESWVRFVASYGEVLFAPKRRMRISRKMALLVVAILVLLGTGICYALNIDLWNIVTWWTDEKLFIRLDNQYVTDDPFGSVGQNKLDVSLGAVWGEALISKMADSGVSISLPYCVDGELHLISCDADRYRNGEVVIRANYEMGEKRFLSITIHDFADVDTLKTKQYGVESDTDVQDIIMYGGNQYYLMSNLNVYTLKWHDGTSSIVITGLSSLEQAETMIYSIVERRD